MSLKNLFLAAMSSVCFASPQVLAQDSSFSDKIYRSEAQNFRFEVLAQQKDVIWGFDFLADGRIIFTEKEGALRIYDPKKKAVIDVKGAPKVKVFGQGGLLDVRVHPQQKSKIYLTYTEPIDSKATTAFAMATLEKDTLKDFKKIFSAHEPNDNKIHFGSRIEFDGQGHVFVSVGDRNERKQVQDLNYHIGKLLRFNDDGSIPKDNPYVNQKNAKPEIWSLGHRSPQGLARHPVTGDLWLAEMGPRGGDELNLIKAKGNYGWPVVTYGREYHGPKIGEGAQKVGIIEPVAYWVPSISPSGIAVYDGEDFPKWKGNIFMGNLSGTHLRRLVLDGQKVSSQEELLKDLALRIRNVRSGPDGSLYLSTDDGKIARLTSVPEAKVTSQ